MDLYRHRAPERPAPRVASSASPPVTRGWLEQTIPGWRQQPGASGGKRSRRGDVPRNTITMKIKSPVTEGKKKSQDIFFFFFAVELSLPSCETCWFSSKSGSRICEQKSRGRKWGSGGGGRKIIYIYAFIYTYIYI